MSANAKNNSLSKVFENRYKGFSGSDESDRRRFLLKLVQTELPDVGSGLGEDSSSQRVYISNSDLYLIYKGLCLAKDSQPEFLFNGNSLMRQERFEELDQESGSDSEELRRLWKSLGKNRGDKQ